MLDMTKPLQKTVATIVANMKMLMSAYNLSADDMARKGGTTYRAVKYVFDGERKPSVEWTDGIASAFGLTAWDMLNPHLTEDLVRKGKLPELVKNYAATNDDGRKHIERAAENEAKTHPDPLSRQAPAVTRERLKKSREVGAEEEKEKHNFNKKAHK